MEKNEILNGYDEKILKKLSSDKNLTISKVQKTFLIDFPLAKEIWKALRSGEEHVLSFSTFREFYFTQERFDYWSQRGCALFDLGGLWGG